MTLGDLLAVAHEIPGRVRFRLQTRPSRALLAALENELDATPGVQRVRVNEAASSVIVEFDPDTQSSSRLLSLPLPADAAAEPLARIDESLVLSASPEAIWRSLDRFQGVPSDHGLIAVEETGPDRWRLTLTLLGQPLELRVVRTEAERAQRLVFRLEGALQGRCVFSLTPEAAGTRVREQVSYSLGDGLLDRTLGVLIEPLLRRLAREQLGGLQAALQRPPESVSEESA